MNIVRVKLFSWILRNVQLVTVIAIANFSLYQMIQNIYCIVD